MFTDHQLVEQIRKGQGEALGQLFDRYGASVFDFLGRVVGDPDEAIYLVVQVFARFSQVAASAPEHVSVRGILLGLARETGLTYLRQRDWLDALPRMTPANRAPSELAADIWQAARAMPAGARATLAVVEHQALSPMEQANALGVMRHALPELIANARRSFREQFDYIAQAHGKPTAALLDAEHQAGLRRRIPDRAASLFTFLPMFVLSEATQAKVRSQIVAAVYQVRPVSASPMPLPTEQRPLVLEDISPRAEKTLIPALVGLGVIALLLIAVLALLAFNRMEQPTTPDTLSPQIKQVNPPNGAILASGKSVVIQANFTDDRGVDVNSVRLIVDSRDVTLKTTVSETSISYATDLNPGQQIAVIELRDTAGNKSSQTWNFTVLEPTPTATGTPVPSVPLSSATYAPTATPPPTSTRAPTATPLPTMTQTPPPLLPDLVVTDISLSPNDEIVYLIRNSGKGDVTAPFLIQIIVDGVVVDSNRRISALGVDQQISLFVPNYRLAGIHSVVVSVNADKTIAESSYANDVLTRTLIGPTPTATPTPTPSATPTFTPTPSPTPTTSQ